MQAVILAGGKGTRFGELTGKTPKSLMLVAEKPILEHTLTSLPSQIDEVIVVIGHLGDQIKNRFRNKFGRIKIKYVDLKYKLLGTAYSLRQTKKLLRDRFLVLNGDDLYNKKELGNLVKQKLAVGLAKTIPPSPKYLSIKLDKGNNITGVDYPTEKEMETGILLATGAYVLNKYIFRYKMVKIANGEYGLPQVIFKMAKKHTFKGVLMKKWIQINRPEDIKKASPLIS